MSRAAGSMAVLSSVSGRGGGSPPSEHLSAWVSARGVSAAFEEEGAGGEEEAGLRSPPTPNQPQRTARAEAPPRDLLGSGFPTPQVQVPRGLLSCLRGLGPCFSGWVFFFFFFKAVSHLQHPLPTARLFLFNFCFERLFIFERQTEHEQGTDREREGDPESKARSRP